MEIISEEENEIGFLEKKPETLNTNGEIILSKESQKGEEEP